MFDLKSITPKDTITLELEHPSTGVPLGAFVTLAGPSHPETLKAGRTALDKQLKKGDRAFHGMTSISLENDVANALAARTLGWSGIVMGGEDVTFSREMAVQIYLDPDFSWIRNQVDAALKDTSRFFES